MKKLLIILLLTACGQYSPNASIRPEYIEVELKTDSGRIIYILEGYVNHKGVVEDVINRIEYANTPKDMTIHIWQTGGFPAKQSSTGFASGIINLSNGHCYLSLQIKDSQYIPALEHEILHWETQDPLAGHRILQCDCNGVVEY